MSSELLEREFHAGFQVLPRPLSVLGIMSARKPLDLRMRSRYCGGLSRLAQTSRGWRAKLMAQAMWWLDHHPDSSVAWLSTRWWSTRSNDPDTANLRSAWLQAEHRHPSNPRVVAGAGLFIEGSDPDLAMQLWRRAVRLDLTKVEDPVQICGEILRSLRHREHRSSDQDYTFKHVISLARTRVKPGNAEEQTLSREFACRIALACGEDEIARQLATGLTNPSTNRSDDWFVDSAEHHGHIVLGSLALKANDMANAILRLLAAGRVQSGFSLPMRGPDMQLAKHLLERDERDVVLEYIDLCARFWESGGHRLSAWKMDVAQGRIPDFKFHVGC
jgi:hypothetical protein